MRTLYKARETNGQNAVTAARRARGDSLRALARRAGVDVQTVLNAEARDWRNDVSATGKLLEHTAVKIATALNSTLLELFEEI